MVLVAASRVLTPQRLVCRLFAVNDPVRPARDKKVETTLDPMRALAHPLRLELLRALSGHGEATSAALARRLNTTTGTTSFHLRKLAAAGLITESENTSPGRRVWRATDEATSLDVQTASPAALQFVQAVLDSYRTNVQRWQSSVSRTPDDDHPGFISDWVVDITLEELLDMQQMVQARVDFYKTRRATPANTETFFVAMLAFPASTEQ